MDIPSREEFDALEARIKKLEDAAKGKGNGKKSDKKDK